MKDFLAIIKASKKVAKQDFESVSISNLIVGVYVSLKKGLLTQTSFVEAGVEIWKDENGVKHIQLIDVVEDVNTKEVEYNGIRIIDINNLNKELTRLGLEEITPFEDINENSEAMRVAVGSHPVVIAYLNSY